MGSNHHLWFLPLKQRLLGRITNLYGSHTLHVVLCMQYSEICTRITCLYGSHPLSVVFACKTATFGAELQVSMGPSPHMSFCAFKTAWLTSELIVSMGPSRHLWLLHAKPLVLDQTYKSLRVPDLTCRLCMQNSVISSRITCLYGSQPSCVVFRCKTATFGPE